ncbi:MAG: hypothetical protein AYL29_004560 [Candidatus Bathyarchaeota archaeon B24]|nr:MAG: hypothetical protein AYL29_004560 [Candidatus Bathyarchaeota archaeon B24]
MTEFDSSRVLNLARRLSFPRFAGSEGEARARELIVEELRSSGYEPALEEFETLTFKIDRAELRVLKPWTADVECAGVGFSGSTPESGVESEVRYVETGERLLLPEEGYILLLSRMPKLEGYKRIMKSKPAGLLVAEGSPHRDLSHVALMPGWRKHGSAPMLRIRFRDAHRILEAGGVRARLTLIQNEWKAKCYNVVVERRGWKYPDEVVVVCAHYDTVYGVPGVIDNACGTALALELARLFSGRRVKRTVRFILFSAEELGLRGSQAYVEKHKDQLENVKMVINLDVHGGALGSNDAIVTGPAQVKPYLEVLSRELGVNLSVREDVMGSDGTPFAKVGVPVVNFSRSSGASAGTHSVGDDGRFVGVWAFESMKPLLLKFLNLLTESEEFPFPREVPEGLKKKITEFFKMLGLEDEE